MSSAAASDAERASSSNSGPSAGDRHAVTEEHGPPPLLSLSRAQDEHDEADEDYEEDEEIYEEIEEEVEEEYEEEEDEEEEDEEQETILTYSTFPVPSLRGQHVMVFGAFVKYLVIGTNEGTVMLLDAATGTTVRQLGHHMDPISDVSCDSSEDFVAASDKAGVISVQNLYDQADAFKREFDSPVQSIALHPKHGKTEDRPAICASGDKVILMAKTMFLGTRKSVILQERRGKVYVVRWCGDLVAWANDRGVTVYSYVSKSFIHAISPPSDSPRPELYRCTLFWETPQILLCGWGDWVQSFTITEIRLEERMRWGADFTKTHRVEAGRCHRTSNVEAPYRLCGLAPMGPDMLFILACVVDQQEGQMRDLEVRVVDRKTFDDVYRGRLNVPYRHPLQFSLAAFIHPVLVDSSYYIVSVDSIIKAIPCDDDDHVEHLLHVGKYEEAYNFSCGSELRRHDRFEVGLKLIEHLVMEEAKLRDAVTWLPQVLQSRHAEWEKWISVYDQRGESDLLVDVLPLGGGPGIDKGSSEPRIRPEFYELVLARCLEKNVALFQRAVKRFEGLYDAGRVCSIVEAKYRAWKRQYARQVSLGISGTGRGRAAAAGPAVGPSTGTAGLPDTICEQLLTVLGDSLGLLLRLQGKDAEALSVLMTVQDSAELFNLIRTKQLYAKALELLPELFEKSQEATIKLLLERRRGPDQSMSISPTPSRANEGDDGDDDVAPDAVPAAGRPENHSTWRSQPHSDPLAPEHVIRRLEAVHRRNLWVYLKALQDNDPGRFQDLSRRHAQLVATLLVEFEPEGLLRFLREKCTFLDNMKEIMAMCQTNHLIEEVSFLMARMGKEEEGLRILVQDLKNVRKAVQFVLDIPNEDDQVELFRKLVQYVVDADARSRGGSEGGGDVLLLPVRGTDTWEGIAAQYDLPVADLLAANRAAVGSRPPNRCRVPVQMLRALLEAVADPAINAHSIIDPVYVIRKLPPNEPIANANRCVSAVARSKHAQQVFMETVVRVLGQDTATSQGDLYRMRVRGLRVDPAHAVCAYCEQRVVGPGMVTFDCPHVFHPACVVEYLTIDGVLLEDAQNTDARRVIRDPARFCRPGCARATLVRCRLCFTADGPPRPVGSAL